MRIEAAKQIVSGLPITPQVLASLRETARLFSTHYSTMIEGNLLTQEQVSQVIEGNQHFPGCERDEKEVLGYYVALEKLEQLATLGNLVTEEQIKALHGLVMAEGRKKAKPTPYRDGQNVIRESRSGRIVYMPPEAKDVPLLMKEMVQWIIANGKTELPCPIIAGIAHYQFATIHPYYDGNGRTARLLTTLILHLGGYDLKGLYSLEEYYARNLGGYYDALNVGSSHNYYEGRAEGDITKWIEYFCAGVADSFDAVRQQASKAAEGGARDLSRFIRQLDPRQRKALELFKNGETITSKNIAALFSISERAARNLLTAWIENGFLIVINSTKRGRKYSLTSEYQELVKNQ